MKTKNSKNLLIILIVLSVFGLGQNAYAHNPPPLAQKVRAGILAGLIHGEATFATYRGHDSLEATLIRRADRYEKIFVDPFDANYTKTVTPVIPDITSLLVGPNRDLENKLILNNVKIAVYADAVATTTNRMMSARVSHDDASAYKQFANLKKYSVTLGYLNALDLRIAPQFISELGQVDSSIYTIFTQDDVNEFFGMLDSSGLPADEIPMLKLLGFSDKDILDITVSSYSSASGLLGTSYAKLITSPENRKIIVQQVLDWAGECAPTAFVKASLGIANTNPGFIVEGDLNKDGMVNVTDLNLAKSNLPAGHVCP